MVFRFTLLAAVLWFFPAWAGSSEDKVFEALLPSVKKTDRTFKVFHWERVDTNLSKKINPDSAEGLLAFTTAASRTFLEEENQGLYMASDPVLSRAFGGGDWRLIQIEVPEGLKLLDLTLASKAFDRLQQALAEDAPCLSAMLKTNTSPTFNGKPPDAIPERCRTLKRNVFRRLGISGVRYSWISPTLDRYCNGEDRSAFIITNGSWLNKKNVKGYTVDSREEGIERKAIQEMLLSFPPHRAYKLTLPAPLWADLPRKAGLSEKTQAWMNENLLNCRSMRVVKAPEDQEEPEAARLEHNSAE